MAVVVKVIAEGRFGDGGVYEPFLNTIRTGDYYLVSDDFDSCQSKPDRTRAPLTTH